MVEVVSLRKDFGSMRAVADISFSVNRGEVVGFLGPNGAGKTTTMRMLTGFLKPSAGSALIQGINVSEDRLGAQRLIGYLPENAPLYDDMIVSEFLDYVAKLRGIIPEKRSPRRKEICERCGLAEVIGKDIGQLSKGYRQRVGLAQAILHDPDLLILDEPTSGLDPNQIVEIRQLIRDLGCEKTVILSTHILPEVQATCGRIIIINDGKLAADDTPDALTEHDSGAVVRLIVKGKDSTKCDVTRIHNVLVGLENIHSVDQCDGEGSGTAGFRLKARGSSDPREAVFNAAISNEFVVLEMHRERASLEDTFRRLTRGEDSNSKEELRA
ncbi:MAG: ATP-binding cassette domain-containing protein [Deltaproteobacteria bacterium]|nr:ATP-binding cassette domain-containing protein [Deltaproteobacteria bacterium]